MIRPTHRSTACAALKISALVALRTCPTRQSLPILPASSAGLRALRAGPLRQSFQPELWACWLQSFQIAPELPELPAARRDPSAPSEQARRQRFQSLPIRPAGAVFKVATRWVQSRNRKPLGRRGAWRLGPCSLSVESRLLELGTVAPRPPIAAHWPLGRWAGRLNHASWCLGPRVVAATSRPIAHWAAIASMLSRPIEHWAVWHSGPLGLGPCPSARKWSAKRPKRHSFELGTARHSRPARPIAHWAAILRRQAGEILTRQFCRIDFITFPCIATSYNHA